MVMPSDETSLLPVNSAPLTLCGNCSKIALKKMQLSLMCTSAEPPVGMF